MPCLGFCASEEGLSGTWRPISTRACLSEATATTIVSQNNQRAGVGRVALVALPCVGWTPYSRRWKGFEAQLCLWQQWTSFLTTLSSVSSFVKWTCEDPSPHQGFAWGLLQVNAALGGPWNPSLQVPGHLIFVACGPGLGTVASVTQLFFLFFLFLSKHTYVFGVH